MTNIQVGVIGGGSNNLPLNSKGSILKTAEKVGTLIAQKHGILISGGMDGVMEASCRGAYLNGGLTIGTLGKNRGSSNKYITVEVCTPIDVGDYLFAGILSCDSIIVFPGGAGTMAEIALAYRYSVPMIIMRGYQKYLDNLIGKSLDNSHKMIFQGADSAKNAVELAFNLLKEQK